MISTQKQLDTLSELRSRLLQTPEVYSTMIEALPNDFALWRPTEDRWNMSEILKHVLIAELHVFRPRMQAILRDSRPLLGSVDPESLLSEYGSEFPDDLEALLEIWRVERAESMELMNAVSEGDLHRVALHSTVGLLTLGELMHKWICHDFEHLRQLCRYAVWYEAPATGPLRRFISDALPEPKTVV